MTLTLSPSMALIVIVAIKSPLTTKIIVIRMVMIIK